MESLKGRLLVASPSLFDPNFRRTVVLVTEHTEDGAAGLVLNRLSETAVVDAVPDLAPLVDDDERVYVGGPVQQSAVLVLAEFEDPAEAATLVVDRVGFVPGDGDFALLAVATRRARVFAGYAGWGADQLEAELEEASWIVEDAEGLDLFPEPEVDLWSTVLRRKGGVYRVVASMPEDPSLN
ncbi:MAG TPA: YqgE/AlgH family protein [Gaiellaceae bacterium]|nr:YqgE/AlgH family protein [Gaiellaceae bacterium]